jgi:hypothetical protein
MGSISNGTEGEAFMERYCSRCVHDRGERLWPGQGLGCGLILQSMVDDDVPEWINTAPPAPIWQPVICTRYTPEPDPGAREPLAS